MRALVTGAAGFIGHHLVNALLELGHEVVGCDNYMTGAPGRVRKDITAFVETPVQSFEFEAAAMDLDMKFDVVFHLAALPRVPVSFENPQLSLANNIDSTIAALEIARKCGAVMVYSSSSSVYGTQEVMPFTEEMLTHPESPYARSKLIGEHLCEEYWQSFNVPCIALRYFNVYGRGMTRGGYATAIGTFLQQAQEGKPITVTGDGLQERDFTHVHDVVRANILAAQELLAARKMDGAIDAFVGAYNIGAGNPQRIIDIAEAITCGRTVQTADGSDPIAYIPARREPKKTHADFTKAQAVLGWVPRTNFEEGLRDLIAANL